MQTITVSRASGQDLLLHVDEMRRNSLLASDTQAVVDGNFAVLEGRLRIAKMAPQCRHRLKSTQQSSAHAAKTDMQRQA